MGTKNTVRVSEPDMTSKTVAPTIFLFLGLTFLLLHAGLPVAQEAGGSDSFKPFVGTWKGICGDGSEFVVLKLGPSGKELAAQ